MLSVTAAKTLKEMCLERYCRRHRIDKMAITTRPRAKTEPGAIQLLKRWILYKTRLSSFSPFSYSMPSQIYGVVKGRIWKKEPPVLFNFYGEKIGHSDINPNTTAHNLGKY